MNKNETQQDKKAILTSYNEYLQSYQLLYQVED
jgi:hypothetical protein